MNTNPNPTRIAKNEDLRRDQNNRLEADNASVNWVNPPYADWICECANPKCSEPVQLSVSEYDEVRTNPTHFIVVPSEKHISADVERVVQRTDRYWIVEKLGIAAAVSKDEDSEPPA